MIPIHEIAQRFDNHDNQSLVDFFTLHLPCQILSVDTLGIERRGVPPVTEFILRALTAGLTSIDDVAGLLGLQHDYCAELFRELELGEFIGSDAFGSHVIWRRGKELLAAGGESSPIDRRLSIVWDPLCKKFLGRVPMYTRRRADADGIIVPLAGAFATPDLEEIGAAALKECQFNVSERRDKRSASYDVLRVTTIQKSLPRYRETLALVYKDDRGDISIRMATNGNIDDDLTTACAQAAIAGLVGVDKSFSSRHGGLSTRKRYGEISKSSKGNLNLEDLVRQRSILRFKSEALEIRLIETELPHLKERKNIVDCELEQIEGKLKTFPIVPMRCHEVRGYLRAALDEANRHVTITSTMPKESKLDSEVLAAIRSCIERGVKVDLYIADRPGTDDQGVLLHFNRMNAARLLNIHFLAKDQRPVFEISCDNKNLSFFNESPLGGRRGPILPREFVGYHIADESLTSLYIESHLKFSNDDVISRIKFGTKEAHVATKAKAIPNADRQGADRRDDGVQT